MDATQAFPLLAGLVGQTLEKLLEGPWMGNPLKEPPSSRGIAAGLGWPLLIYRLPSTSMRLPGFAMVTGLLYSAGERVLNHSRSCSS